MKVLRENYATWQCGSHELSLARPRIMGILNVTPDSFSDGGKNFDTKAAIARGREMLDEGADIIDVGGESTRPGSEPVSSNEEASRIVPVVRALVASGAIVSVDTRHADVAKICARLGASIINDVEGFTSPAMIQVAADTNCGCIVMHWDKGGLGTRPPRRRLAHCFWSSIATNCWHSPARSKRPPWAPSRRTRPVSTGSKATSARSP